MKSQSYVFKKSHIFLTSAELFLEKGFVKTTLDNILKRAAISKGTFYHYFSSKEALLDELTEDVFQHLLHNANLILLDTQKNVAEKLNLILALPVQLKLDKNHQVIDIFQLLNIKGNEEIRQKFETSWHRHLFPIICQLLERGNQCGYMQVSNLSQMATLIIQLGINLRMHAIDDTILMAYQQCIERTLMLPVNSINFTTSDLIQTLQDE